MIQLTDKVYAVEVPSMAFGLMVNNYADESELFWMLSMPDIADDDNAEETLITKPLPPGSWCFLFTTKTATEEDAMKVVAWIEITGKIGYYDYIHPEPYRYLEKWEESLRSFLLHKELDPNKNYALIEKQSSDER